jgi:hypothetical protein
MLSRRGCLSEDVVARMLSCKGCCRAEDVVTQRMLSCCRRDVVAQEDVVVAQRMLSRRDVVTQRMLSRRGCCRAEDVVVQRMLLCRGCCRAQRMLLHRGCCRAEDFPVHKLQARCVNDWFSGQLQDQFLTNWRGILKIPERFLSRTNQIIKTSLIFAKCVTDWEIQRNI